MLSLCWLYLWIVISLPDIPIQPIQIPTYKFTGSWFINSEFNCVRVEAITINTIHALFQSWDESIAHRFMKNPEMCVIIMDRGKESHSGLL